MEAWIRSRVAAAGAIEVAHQRPWATVLRVPVAGGAVWFKACGAVQRFEPRLTATLFARWPDRVVEVLDHDWERGWLLIGDAGMPVGAVGNPPEAWLAALPAYAELQRGEAAHALDHLAGGVPDLRVERLPERWTICFDATYRFATQKSHGCAPSHRVSANCAANSAHAALRTRSSTTTSTTRTSTCVTGSSACSIGATPRSRIRSGRWSSRSAFSRRSQSCRLTTPGSHG